jgi:hypothetical protein
MTIWRMRVAFWISKAINTHSEYLILIAFLVQQWLHELAYMLRYRPNACLVSIRYKIRVSQAHISQEIKVNVYISSLMMKVPDHVYVLG